MSHVILTRRGDELFKSLRALNKGATAEDVAIARAKSDIAQTIINSVKVEIDAARVFGGTSSAFIPAIEQEVMCDEPKKTVVAAEVRQLATGTLTCIGSVSRHTIK